LSLSVVKLDGVVVDSTGVRILVSGVDAVDGTPVIDIKPYVPYADAVAGAVGGFAAGGPVRLPVLWDCAAPEDAKLKELVEQTLALNPAPAYQEDAQRVYRSSLASVDLEWRVTAEAVRVLALRYRG
jgi:hypothetical protein